MVCHRPFLWIYSIFFIESNKKFPSTSTIRERKTYNTKICAEGFGYSYFKTMLLCSSNENISMMWQVLSVKTLNSSDVKLNSIFTELWKNTTDSTTHWLYWSFYARKMRVQCWNHFWYQESNWHLWQLKESKSWGPFWSYQLNSTANPAHLPQKWAKWAELAVLFSW